MNSPRVVLLPRRAKPFYGGHPWVYAGAIASVEGSPADGDEVDLYSHAGDLIARGLYNSRSKIRVRLYPWNSEQALDRDFFRGQLEAAIAHARARQTRARQLEERIAALENRVGESIVDAHVLAYERRGSVPHDDPATSPTGAGGEAESG